MNVLFFCNRFWPEGKGGGELATYLYSKLLAEKGVNVRVFCETCNSNNSVTERINGVIVLRIPASRLLGNSKYASVMRIPVFITSRWFRYLINWADVVYVTGWFSAIPIIKKVFKKPTVVHIHSYFPFCPVGPFYNLAKKSFCQQRKSLSRCFECIFCYEKAHGETFLKSVISAFLNSTIGRKYTAFTGMADKVLFVSKRQRDSVLKQFPQIRNKSKVIYNPIPEIECIPIEGDNLGYFGGTSLLKGFTVLIKAWAKISNSKQNINLHATNVNKFPNPIFLKKIGVIPYDYLKGDALVNLYRRIKAVVVPSIWHECLPYIVTESLLRGRAVVASEVGGIPEIADRLSGVFLVNPGDVNDLAKIIEEVLSMSREKIKGLGMENREQVLKKFDNQKIIDRFIRTLEEVI